ncbi:MAG TPA: PKD domain-containing protein [Planctomycetota bacterium]|nr:PKD domain-containing protein [Planctomycetota bacterium]
MPRRTTERKGVISMMHREILRGRILVAAAILPLWAATAEAQLIGTVDYSDTFTLGMNGRANGIFGAANIGAYALEDTHGNPASTWHPQTNYSFNDIPGSFGQGPTVLAAATGNPGAETGVAQSGGGDFSFAYGLRTNYVVETDAFISPGDRTDISSLPTAGATIFTPRSLSVFFRRDSIGANGIGLYNGSTETHVLDEVGDPVRIGVDDDNWHRLAVHFNQDEDRLGIYVDGDLLADLDLTTFAGGIYQNYSNGAVGAGGAGAFVDGKVLWFDNFQVGAPPVDISACFTASAVSGTAPLTVSFDASCSIFTGTPASYEWAFGDGMNATGETVDHAYTTGGRFEATLTVRDTGGMSATASRTITLFAEVASYSDDFNRPDGAIDGWMVHSVPGTWNILNQELVTGPSNEERWIWAGDPAVIVPERTVIRFDMRFNGPGSVAAVGRHAGAAFAANRPTHRLDGGMTGYFVDWIDRPSDHGLRLTRVDNGVLVLLVGGAAGSPAEPPLEWRVEITTQKIRVYGDDVLYIDHTDSTYRVGFAGLWTWAGGQDVAFDNFSVEESQNPLSACFTTDAPRLVTVGTGVALDATCTENVGAGTLSHEWSFGDGTPNGMGQTVTHAYAAPGGYTVELTVRDTLGNTSTSSATIDVLEKVLTFSDDFERPDGPVDGWTVYAVPGTWNIANGELVTGPTNEERWIWAGDPPVAAPQNAVYTWDQIFVGPGSVPDIGRHAGFAFAANRATHRYDPAFTGYFVDWIDRAGDRGLRLSRSDNGILREIILGQASIPVPEEPPVVWTVEIEDDHIRLFGDGVEYFDVVDSTYRGGLFGFWTWTGGQELAFDNVEMTGDDLTACFTTTPATLIKGQSILFDGTCSESVGSTVASHDWDLGDGTLVSGATVQHTYAEAGDYTVKITVKDTGGKSDTFERTLTVGELLEPFADCFERAPGPVDGWTSVLGDWTITDDGEVETITQGLEAFLYAGDPTRSLGPAFVAEVDWTFVAGTHPDVGRHGAVHFYWSNLATNRFAAGSNGYSVFYIDRAADRGLTLMRWDNGAFTTLNPPGGTPSLTEPPATLRIEADATSIRVYGDGVLVIDVDDSTYREGFFALWSWMQNHVRFDNVRIGTSELPACDSVPGDRFVRGDSDSDGAINITDALVILLYLFQGGQEPACFDAADADDNGSLQITDAVRILGWLFTGGVEPASPSPSAAAYPASDCGVDPTNDDGLDCGSFPPCQ